MIDKTKEIRFSFSMNNEQENQLLSQVISWLRFPLILLVVFIHCPGLPELRPWIPITSVHDCMLNIYNVSRSLVNPGLTRIAVPMFFIISGYLFFANIKTLDKEAYTRKISSRIKSLLLPYLAWNIMFALFYAVYSFHKGVSFNLFDLKLFWGFSSAPTTNILGQTILVYYPIHNVLWFVRDLFILSLLTPMIFILAKRLKLFLPIIAIVLYVFNIWSSYFFISVASFCFFTLGGYFGIQKWNLIVCTRHIEKKTYVLGGLFLCLSVWLICNNHSCSPINNISCILEIIMTFNIASRIIEHKCLRIPKQLSNCTFFIYASHTLNGFNQITPLLIPAILPTIFYPLFWLLTPIAKTLFSIVLYMTLKKILPGIAKFLNGYR